MFFPRNTPSMIVNNTPSLTVVQMAAFQFGDRPVWVEDCRSLGICKAPHLTERQFLAAVVGAREVGGDEGL